LIRAAEVAYRPYGVSDMNHVLPQYRVCTQGGPVVIVTMRQLNVFVSMLNVRNGSAAIKKGVGFVPLTLSNRMFKLRLKRVLLLDC
jgi:hypothetical protein